MRSCSYIASHSFVTRNVFYLSYWIPLRDTNPYFMITSYYHQTRGQSWSIRLPCLMLIKEESSGRLSSHLSDLLHLLAKFLIHQYAPVPYFHPLWPDKNPLFLATFKIPLPAYSPIILPHRLIQHNANPRPLQSWNFINFTDESDLASAGVIVIQTAALARSDACTLVSNFLLRFQIPKGSFND